METSFQTFVQATIAFLKTRKGKLLLMFCGVAWLLWYTVYGQVNPNPLRRVENATPFIWPKNCTKQAVDRAIVDSKKRGGSPKLPCSCASSENEIKDWYNRGLYSYGMRKDRPFYYRIGNDAFGIQKRPKWSRDPICFYISEDSSYARNFFITGSKR